MVRQLLQVLTDLQQPVSEEITGLAPGTLMDLYPQIALLCDA